MSAVRQRPFSQTVWCRVPTVQRKTNYSNPAFSQEINLFVICNYTDEIIDKFKDGVAPLSNAWLNEVCEVVESKSTSKNTTIWAENNFLMTNAVIAASRSTSSSAANPV